MELLKQRIREAGIARTEEILDVSTFFNAQVDAKLMQAIGDDFAEHFKDHDFDVFVTVESSGIAPSVFASLAAQKPLVIIKKSQKVMDDPRFVQQASFSFTKGNAYHLTTQLEFIKGKRIILIDDFLAQGSVVTNVETLLHKADATLVATGICISKDYQPGYQKLSAEGKDVYCQVHVTALEPQTNAIHIK